ncbi:MAG: cation:proton antiporter, partial [Tannerellaceae bacterium]|nr:cation:proton antiporter [Tannerellaceae bacterium]
VVICGYMASQLMGISGPLTMVSAGLVIGNTGREFSQKNHLDMSFMKIFWELMDEILNAVLFLLIGFEVLLIPDIRSYWIPGLIAVVIVLVSRYISIKIPTLIIPFKEKFTRATFLILVWGGLRGGSLDCLGLIDR